MKVKIIEKEYPRNERYRTNRVKFEVNDYLLSINIIYMNFKDRRFNAFTCDKLYEQCQKYITDNFELDWELFKKYFMYKLYKYSKGIGLDKSELNISSDEIKLVENI